MSDAVQPTSAVQPTDAAQRPGAARHSVLGIVVDAIDYQAAVERILQAAQQRRSLAVTALAVHGVMTGVLDRQHQYRLNRFDLVCPDGQPVRHALNLLHATQLTDRVYGPELMLRVCQTAALQGVPVFLFGGTQSMLTALTQRLQERFPTLQIVGSEASQFRQLSADEREALADRIEGSGAGLCLVGLGCPRQEIFVYEMRDRIRMPLLAVGAAFAFHAGALPQAPPWMQRYSLEWLYRLMREPRRLWRRYLYLNPLFLALLGLQRLGIYSGNVHRGRPPQREWRFG